MNKFFFGMLGLLVWGCGEAPPETATEVQRGSQALIGGRDSTAAQNASGILNLAGQFQGGAILIADNLAITARNMVQPIIRRDSA